MSELLSNSETSKSNSSNKISHAGFILGIVLGLALAVLVVARKPEADISTPPETYSPALNDTVSLIQQAMQQVSSDYIDEIDPQVLADAALKGMFTELDTYSRYLDEETYQKLIEHTDGEYLGLGIQAEEHNGVVNIVSVVENSPAFKLGLLVGDEILTMNGQGILEQPYKELLNQTPDQESHNALVLLIKRELDVFEVSLNRELIAIDSVDSVFIADNHNQNDGLAYLRLSHFNEHTASDLKTKLLELQNTTQPLYGLILDLRNNPGGLVNSAVEVADLFLESGTIVSANGRAADADFKYKANAGELLAGLPLVVLINGATASAAEILAAALKEQDRATLVGEHSYGKGLVQTIIPLRSGALKLTTSRYYTPSGLSINERGIRPHLKVKDSDMMMAINDLKVSHKKDLPIYMAIKDPALLRAWQTINKLSSRDQIAMKPLNINTIGTEQLEQK